MSQLRQAILEEAYQDVVKVVHYAVAKFKRRYQLTDRTEELVSTANEIFVDACTSYRSSNRTKFTTWVYYRVWHGLLDDVRQRVRIARRIEQADLESVPERRSFRLEDLELGNDAHKVVCLALKGRGNAYQIRRGLRPLLRDLGWSKQRIEQALVEIADALKER